MLYLSVAAVFVVSIMVDLLQSTERLNPVSTELAAKVERGLSAAGESLPRKSIFQECKE